MSTVKPIPDDIHTLPRIWKWTITGKNSGSRATSKPSNAAGSRTDTDCRGKLFQRFWSNC